MQNGEIIRASRMTVLGGYARNEVINRSRTHPVDTENGTRRVRHLAFIVLRLSATAFREER